MSNGSKRLECSITEPLTLGKLRWLVAECEELADAATVSVKEHRSLSFMDQDQATITVRGAIGDG